MAPAASPRRGIGGRLSLALAAASALFLAPAAAAQVAPSEIADAVDRAGGLAGELRGFYGARAFRPLWIDGTRLRPAAYTLLELARSSSIDRVKPSTTKARDLEKALDKAHSGKPQDLLRAELAASRTLALYVEHMRKAKRDAMISESPALEPTVPKARYTLNAAAAARDLDAYVAGMGWMHPLYAGLRRPLVSPDLPKATRDHLVRNLDRVRAIPANPARRYVLVDTASARLWMYEDGKPTGSMRVVVGKPDPHTQTPMMAGFLRFAQVNPYWNIPQDLVQQRIAANVVSHGTGYLRSSGYQVLSDWSDKARVIDPSTIYWHAVAAGTREVRVRQLPGGNNFMGKVKFMFPNDQGIYLHDTPDKQLMRLDARQLSSGCVRLEDAARFGRWLMNKPLPTRTRAPEQRIDLPEPVPIFITYLTAMPGPAGEIAMLPDVYGRDGAARMAAAGTVPRGR